MHPDRILHRALRIGIAAVVLAFACAATAQAPPALTNLIAEALERNPEIQAAARERDAAERRVPPAGALDDPMLEAGIVNLPVSGSFRREDMTMKMLGLSQRIPYPGKRGLRQAVAERDVEVVGHGFRETTNRVVRDVRVSYTDLSLVDETTRIVRRNRAVVEQFLKTAEARYSLGQATQSDVLKAQTQLARMLDELIRLEREQSAMTAELERAIGRTLRAGEPDIAPLEANGSTLALDSLRERAMQTRPQILALQAAVARADKATDLVRSDYYPDFDVKLAVGQRDRMSDGTRREEMVSLTVAINLPIWQDHKRDPRVAEALAMREQAASMLRAQQNELGAKLRQQVALAEQGARSARLYADGILPQARLAVEAALAAYRVNRVDFLTLLDAQMAVFNYEIAHVQSIAGAQKARAEIGFLVGEAIPPPRRGGS